MAQIKRVPVKMSQLEKPWSHPKSGLIVGTLKF